MRISDVNNYSSLQESQNGKGWCYSRDSKKIEIAKTLWEKICYVGRTLIFSNGSEKTLQEAIIRSFSPEDQAMIRAKLKNMKELKRVEKIERVASVAPEGLKPMRADKLLDEVDKVPTEELVARPGLSSICHFLRNLHINNDSTCLPVQNQYNSA